VWKPFKSKDVMVLGVHSGESKKLLNDFVKQTGVTYPIVGQSGWVSFNFPPGTGYPYPKDVVFDKKGVVRSIKSSFSTEEIKALVQKLMNEKP